MPIFWGVGIQKFSVSVFPQKNRGAQTFGGMEVSDIPVKGGFPLARLPR